MLARLDSKTQPRLEDDIKASTQRFDVAIVFKLSLANRALSAVPSLAACVNLQDLNLCKNGITKIEGLEALAGSLRRLNLSSNRISKLEGLAALFKLERLELQDNKLDSVRCLDLHNQLAPLTALRALYLQHLVAEQPSPGNACCHEAGYKEAVLAAVPALANLDGERSPSTSAYAQHAHDMAEMVLAGPATTKREVELPAIKPWLDSGATQPEDEWEVQPVDQEVEKEKMKLLKALEKCQLLANTLSSELAHAQRSVEERAVRDAG